MICQYNPSRYLYNSSIVDESVCAFLDLLYDSICSQIVLGSYFISICSLTSIVEFGTQTESLFILDRLVVKAHFHWASCSILVTDLSAGELLSWSCGDWRRLLVQGFAGNQGLFIILHTEED